MMFKPHDYQTFAIRHILTHEQAALFLNMGFGKTVITLTAIEHLMYHEFEIRKPLIIAPLKYQSKRASSSAERAGTAGSACEGFSVAGTDWEGACVAGALVVGALVDGSLVGAAVVRADFVVCTGGLVSFGSPAFAFL